MTDKPCPHASYEPTTSDDCPICLRERVEELEAERDDARSYIANMYSGNPEATFDRPMTDRIVMFVADLESQLYAWPGGPTWQELVERHKWQLGFDGMTAVRTIQYVLQMKKEDAERLCSVLGRDPETDEKIGGEG